MIVWTLEQKVDRLEKDYQYLTIELASQLTNEISQKINLDLAKYLPKAHTELLRNKRFRERMEHWLKEKDMEFDNINKYNSNNVFF